VPDLQIVGSAPHTKPVDHASILGGLWRGFGWLADMMSWRLRRGGPSVARNKLCLAGDGHGDGQRARYDTQGVVRRSATNQRLRGAPVIASEALPSLIGAMRAVLPVAIAPPSDLRVCLWS
jgi:hypothetical protein